MNLSFSFRLERLNPCVGFICTLAIKTSLGYIWEKINNSRANTLPLAPKGWRNRMAGSAFFLSLSLASFCLHFHINKAQVNRESFRRHLEGCPFISSPGTLIKYPGGPHLVGNKIQSRRKMPGCWSAIAINATKPLWYYFNHSQCQDFSRAKLRAFSLHIFPCAGFSGSAAPWNVFTTQARKELLNMTESNTITLIS